jgi:hypothetical protein
MSQIRNSKVIAGILSLALTFFAVRHSQKLFLDCVWISGPLISSLFFGGLTFLTIYLERPNSNFLLEGFKKLLVYQTAFILFLFGWMKIFKLQINTSIIYLDMPVGVLSGYQFSLAFYGYSYSFIVFIGCLQLIGATFLLFKNTRLLGILILVPILANIILTNITYSIGIGVTLMATVLLLACLFLMLEDYEKIKALIFSKKNNKEATKKQVNFSIKALILAIPLLLGVLNYKTHTSPEIIGKYSVKNYSLNGKDFDYQSCSDTLLSSIYFDENQDCIFRYGNDFETLKVGKLKVHKNKKSLEVIWRYPKNYTDTLKVNLEKIGKEKQYRIKGKLGTNDVVITLIKE